jgi:hypothetical protein
MLITGNWYLEDWKRTLWIHQTRDTTRTTKITSNRDTREMKLLPAGREMCSVTQPSFGDEEKREGFTVAEYIINC